MIGSTRLTEDTQRWFVDWSSADNRNCRAKYGPFTFRDLYTGPWRFASPCEVLKVRHAVAVLQNVCTLLTCAQIGI